LDESTISLQEKVVFLSRPEAYPEPATAVTRRETHMSWVFLADAKVYKLKKPVRFPYLDFSTLARREAACRAELALNRRLAPDVYEAVVPLVHTPRGLAIGADGQTVDWLVVMRRLDEELTLERALIARRLTTAELDRLVGTLVYFYRRANVVYVSAQRHLSNWQRSLADNRRGLLDPRFKLPPGLVRMIDRAQRRFLVERSELIAGRVSGRHIVDGHGDLRPEHIWLSDPVRIIDCIEFNSWLRVLDPFDEIAYLCVECDRLGGGWASEHIRRRILQALAADLPGELFAFYRCYRATLRARLSIAHLLEPEPRTPEKWPALARTYLDLAAADAIRLERSLKRRANH
jgi:aminoglycoside phosphotransferase family enzyme